MIPPQKRVCAGSPEMSETNATVQGEPSSQLVLIFHKDGRNRTPEFLALGRDHRSAIPSVDRKQLVVALPENLDSDARGVLISRVGSRDYASDVVGAAIILRDEHARVGRGRGVAGVVGPIEVVERRDCQNESSAHRMQPGKI